MPERVEVLTCTSCGAAIPFGDEPTTTCPFCKTSNPVPEPYRELRASRALDAASRARAEKLFRTIDRPAWIGTKVLARMFDLPMIAFWFAYTIPLALYVVFAMLRFATWIAPKLGYRTGDDVPFWILCLFGFSLVLVLVFVPRALGIYANRRATARMRLTAALAAKPPKTAGGPAECRSCGAPLHVATDELVVVCPYCGTENAVQIRTELAASAQKSARRLASTVAEVAAIDRGERRKVRIELVRELIRYVVITGVFGTAFALSDNKKYGTIAVVVAGLLLIALPIISLARKDKHNDEAERKSGNDVPGWVALLGPILVWGFFIYGPRFL